MNAIAATPGARRLLSISIVARLPLTMLSVGLLFHARYLTGSFAAAGAVDATYAVALGLGGPLLGRIVDRRGQTGVLLTSSVAAASLLATIALLPLGTPLPLLLALAGAIGAVLPPLGACLRALVPKLIPDPDGARAFYALDATALELTWITGPALAVTVGSLWSTGIALAGAGTMLLAGTAAFAAEPASRRWRPAPPPARAQTRTGPGVHPASEP
jgi:MFS family permease